MNVIKTVKITFASPKLNAANYAVDIYEALEHAKLNLLSRYDVGIRNFRILDYKSVAVDMAIPEDISESFNIGSHLRGVSKYMIGHHEERYKSFCVGTRLLYYEDVTKYFPPRIVDYNGMSDDLISRQAAIEIIDGYMNRLAKHIGTPTDNERYAYARGTLLGVEAGINALPSAQSERKES